MGAAPSPTPEVRATPAPETPSRSPKRSRPPRWARQVGAAFSAGFNLLLLWLINVSPGWDWVPFLAPEFVEVVDLINASLWLGLVLNLSYLLADPPWARALGDAATGVIGAVVLWMLWQDFPFVLSGGWADWADVLRVALAVLTVLTVISVVANVAKAIRLATARPSEAGGPTS
jgi:hypothetical protein